jgi:aldehyde dehydrogenase (NAD+)
MADIRSSLPPIPRTQLLIDNRWVDAADGGELVTYDPSTGREITRVMAATAVDVDRAVAAARRAMTDGDWVRMDAADRGRMLYRLADLVERDAEGLARLEALDSGKLIEDARADVHGVVEMFRYYAGWADKLEGRTLPIRGEFFSYTVREPVGVVAQIIPWNFPLSMLAWKWAPALACGNAVVLKPAEQTPLTALWMGELALEAGVPPGVINILNGIGEVTGAALVDHPGVDKIAFTGHVDTAKIIQRRAAESLKRLTFELGGKSPNVVFADADLDQAVEGAFHAIYFHGGQCCTAGSRLFVERRIHDAFVERLVARAKTRRLGDPLDPSTEQGPQVSREQQDKTLSYVERGVQAGAQLLTGGHKPAGDGYFVEPTVFSHVTDQMAIARDEIFGPVVGVLEFSSIDEVIARANDTIYGLAAAVWTKNVDTVQRFAKHVKAGTIWVNCYHVIDTTTPFGGMKMSGHGRENGAAALEHYTELKTVTMRLGRTP